MIIKELRASFGKLKGTLQLQEGYNELYLPNEAGKSTWSAFLVAMLYGIDTSERASAQNQGLPAKERYRPWDGSPMEGAVELEWQGRSITIERSTQGRMPMGKFTAYEPHSGTPIPELTGENCGRILCGVERSVFERSAFIRQLGLAVSKDAALEKRMNALVTTGEEEGLSASQLEKELKNRRTKLIGRAGRIPKSSAQLEEVEQRLQEIHRLRAETMGLSAQKESQTQKLQAAQAQLDRLEAARQAQKRAGLADLEVKLQQQEALCKELEEAVRALPAEEALHSLQKQLEQKESALETAKLDAAFFSGAVERPEAVRGFENCSAAEALPQAERDSREIRRLLALRTKTLYLAMILFALCLAAGAVLAFFLGTAGWAVLGLGALGLAVCLILYAKSAAGAKQARQKAAALLARYGAADAEALLPLAREHCARMEGYERLSAQNSSARAQLLAEEAQAREELEALLQQIRMSGAPAILVINKIDTVQEKEDLLAVIAAYNNEFEFDAVMPISARYKDGVDALLKECDKYAEESPFFFPEDATSDQPEKQVIAEIIREKLLWNLEREIPHGTAVDITKFSERDNGVVDVDATIYCEKASHKGMIIGKQGAMLKKISTAAREDAERFMGTKVFLQTWVKVKENWRDSDFLLRNFGYE